ncbi:MAG: hypothetical protein QM487_14545 [Candidatus Marithrix sp.]
MANLTKKVLIGATLLATSSAWGKNGLTSTNCTDDNGQGISTGCKDQPGVNYLVLDQMPGANTRICADNSDATTKSGASLLPNRLTVAVDPFKDAYIELIFEVSEIIASDEAHVLFLVYSTQLSPSPQMPTPRSKHKLKLDLAALEILAIYNIPALPLMAQSQTRLGQANPAPTAKISFKVNLDTATLPTFMRNDSDIIFLQAALLKADQYANGDFSGMIMSEVDRIQFVQECSSTASYIEMDDNNKLTTVLRDNDGGNMTKTSRMNQAIDIEVDNNDVVEVPQEQNTTKTKN